MLKFDRLETFITKLGYLVQRVYALHGKILFIELLSPKNVHALFIEVPSKYNFPSTGIHNTVYEIEPISLHETGTEVDDYVYTSEMSIKSIYSRNTRTTLPSDRSIASHLSQSYKKGVVLDDMRGADTMSAKSIHRQAKRLQYCIEGTSYTVCLLRSPFFALRDVVYKVSGAAHQDRVKLILCVGLSDFYNKPDTIEHDATRIVDGISQVLKDNSTNHITDMDEILSMSKNVQHYVKRIQSEKKSMELSVQDAIESISNVMAQETAKREALEEVARTIPSGDLRMDMRNESKIATIDKELKRIESVKRGLFKTVHEARSKHNDMTLKVDSILFDNLIMLDKITTNIKILSELI